MILKLALDTGILGDVCHPRIGGPVRAWLVAAANDPRVEILVPAVADYELRRKLNQLALRDRATKTPSLTMLDDLRDEFFFLTLSNAALRRAAGLWAKARHGGYPTAAKDALDGDVLIAAQALEAGATVVTDNRKHIGRYCAVADWRTLTAPFAATS